MDDHHVLELEKRMKVALGPDAVFSDPAFLRRFSRDWWGGYLEEEDHAPSLVVRPANTLDVSEVVSIAHSHSIPVVPWGGGSGMSGAVTPVRGGLVMDLSRMTRIVDLDVVGRTARVEPGITVTALNQNLRPHQLWWPHLPESSRLASIGGCLAHNGLGCYASRHGHAPQMVSGVRAVLADGSIVDLGSHVRTSSSGYRLLDLIMTSEGTLAIITEVLLKLRSLPPEERLEAYLFPGIAEVILAAREICDAGLVPDLLLLEDARKFRGLASAPEHDAALDAILSAGDGVLITLYAGSHSLVQTSSTLTQEIIQEMGGQRIDRKSILDRWWLQKSVTPEASCNEDLAGIPGKRIAFCDIGVPATRIEDIWRAHREIITELGLDSFGLRAYFLLPNQDVTVVLGVMFDAGSETRACREWARRISKKGADFGGTSSTTMGVGLRLAEVASYEHRSGLAMMTSIKRALDPRGILNPGKVPFCD